MRDMQDCEFTVQDGVLFMLQTRNGKRTGPAALQGGGAPACCGVQPLQAFQLGYMAAAALIPRPGIHATPLQAQVAVAMEREGLVSRAEAVLMVEPRHLAQMLHPMFDGEW